MSNSQQRERCKSLQVRLSAAELEQVSAAARGAGLSLSGYSRAQLLGSVTPRTQKAAPLPERQDLARILAALGKMGGNLNQLSHRNNAGQTVADLALIACASEVQAAAEDIRRILRQASK